MDRDRIIDLLKIASAYDNRKPDRASILAWEEASRRGRWNFDRAKDAIHHHYANSAERIMPGHITAHHRTMPMRADERSVDEALQLGQAPASPERRAELMAQVRRLADRKQMPNA